MRSSLGPGVGVLRWVRVRWDPFDGRIAARWPKGMEVGNESLLIDDMRRELDWLIDSILSSVRDGL
jgi:hypothetical protein